MKQLQSPLSWWLRGARVVCLAISPVGRTDRHGAGTAGAPDLIIPPTLLLPNYDRIYPGLTESLEGGAYIARARNAPALFYNPAGIATVQRTVLNASAQGYEATVLGGSGFAHRSPSRASPPFPASSAWSSARRSSTGRTSDRLSASNPVSWDQTAAAGTVPQEGQRIAYSVHSSFKTLVPAASIGWACDPGAQVRWVDSSSPTPASATPGSSPARARPRPPARAPSRPLPRAD